MYKKNPLQTEIAFEDFFLPFGGKLRSDNRWVRLSKLIPWEQFESSYADKFGTTGNTALPFRVALGSLIIKERLGLTDEETVEQIRENPYLQFFLGYDTFFETKPFDPSLMVHFRKRIGFDNVQKMNEMICAKNRGTDAKRNEQKGDDHDSDDSNPSGKLIIDATCAPEDIRYPTDVSLVNDAREVTEQVIDILWGSNSHLSSGSKPRTYRTKARKQFVAFVKNKKASSKKVMKSLRQQLRFLKRNLSHIDTMTKAKFSCEKLTSTLHKKLLVASEVCRQQTEHVTTFMTTRRHHIDDRIVSISKPHVRPIVRGKAAAAVEFGAKLSVSVVDGLVWLDRLSWDAFNEGNDLRYQAEKYKERNGKYPTSIHADKIYQTRDNRQWCKEQGIRLSGAKLGRPSINETMNEKDKRQRYLDGVDRIAIEGKFGVAKRKFSLSRIMTKLRETSEFAIAMVFLVMNLEKYFCTFIQFIIHWLECELHSSHRRNVVGYTGEV